MTSKTTNKFSPEVRDPDIGCGRTRRSCARWPGGAAAVPDPWVASVWRSRCAGRRRQRRHRWPGGRGSRHPPWGGRRV